MWSDIVVYLRLGLSHIADLSAYDHIVFLLVLSGVYTFRDWRHIAWLVTAFTVGHSVTLVLATLRLFTINEQLVEVLIPVTIIAAAAENIVSLRPTAASSSVDAKARYRRYLFTALFGLVHGLGFSNFLRALLGSENSLVVPLLSFNVGLELGQLVIVSLVLVVATMVGWAGVRRRNWVLVVSGLSVVIAVVMLVRRLGGI